MNFAEAVALCAVVLGLICFAGMGLEAYKRRLSNRERELELRLRQGEAQAGARQARAGEIEERLRVLERIATDGGAGLALQIEKLRVREREMEELP